MATPTPAALTTTPVTTPKSAPVASNSVADTKAPPQR